MIFRLLLLFGIYYYVYHYLGIQTINQFENFVMVKLNELDKIANILISLLENAKKNLL